MCYVPLTLTALTVVRFVQQVSWATNPGNLILSGLS